MITMLRNQMCVSFLMFMLSPYFYLKLFSYELKEFPPFDLMFSSTIFPVEYIIISVAVNDSY